MYQRIGSNVAYKADLKNTEALDAYFETRIEALSPFMWAGTNGKGSVSHLIG
jgi:dihydrofolate synthase / folylpolyglutamate synthase